MARRVAALLVLLAVALTTTGASAFARATLGPRPMCCMDSDDGDGDGDGAPSGPALVEPCGCEGHGAAAGCGGPCAAPPLSSPTMLVDDHATPAARIDHPTLLAFSLRSSPLLAPAALRLERPPKS